MDPGVNLGLCLLHGIVPLDGPWGQSWVVSVDLYCGPGWTLGSILCCVCGLEWWPWMDPGVNLGLCQWTYIVALDGPWGQSWILSVEQYCSPGWNLGPILGCMCGLVL